VVEGTITWAGTERSTYAPHDPGSDAGRRDAAVLFDGPSNRVFTLNGDAHSSTVIDPRAGTPVTNIPLGGKPEYGASAGDGKVYANLTDTSEVVEIDARAATVARRWSTAPCKQPVAMAIDTVHHRLFSGCRSGVLRSRPAKAARVASSHVPRMTEGIASGLRPHAEPVGLPADSNPVRQRACRRGEHVDLVIVAA